MDGGGHVPRGPGGRAPDWNCPSCGLVIFGSKPECNRCHVPNPAYRRGGNGGNPGGKVPDWPCPGCRMLIFGSKAECGKCHIPNPAYGSQPGGGGSGAAGRRPDWPCPGCKMTIWGSKDECFKCHIPNPAIAMSSAGIAVAAAPAPAPAVERRERAPDWYCNTCRLMIYGSKDECLKCHTKNPGKAATALPIVGAGNAPSVAGAGVVAAAAAEGGGGGGGVPQTECVVCMDRKVSYVAKECGHLAVCGDCSKTLEMCPICRTPTGYVKLFEV